MMGLDMYLQKRHYVERWEHVPAEKQFEVTVTRGGENYAPIRQDRIAYVVEQIAYWRKANAIHRWFVDHVQGGRDECQESYVSRAQLAELLSTVQGALAVYDAKGDCAEVLPTRSGFFFGDTEYSEGYREDLIETERMLVAILAEPEDEASYYYHSSW